MARGMNGCRGVELAPPVGPPARPGNKSVTRASWRTDRTASFLPRMTSPLSFRGALLAATSLLAFAVPSGAQIIQLRATINAAQEVPATTSRATGTGVILYDLATNTYDLIVHLDGFANPVTDTHLQEAAAGATGRAVVHAGDERVYTRTNGATLDVSFLNRTYPGDRTKLLQNGAYLNFHSTQFAARPNCGIDESMKSTGIPHARLLK